MSLRSIALALGLSLALAACGSSKASSHEPTTAREKQRREARASGELDKPSTKWGGWRYQGDRDDCFFVVGRSCFKTENAACQAARCKAPRTCATIGGGPATVSCSKQ